MAFYKSFTVLLLALLLSLQMTVSALAVEVPVPVENTDQVELAGVSAELSHIPESLLAAFRDMGWSIHMNRAYLEEMSRDYGFICVASTSYKAHRIYLTSTVSLVHEFGHFLHYALDFPEETEAMYLEEAANASFLREYAKRNFREYFADCFAYWLRNRADAAAMERMNRDAPETFSCFSALEENGWALQEMSKRVSS